MRWHMKEETQESPSAWRRNTSIAETESGHLCWPIEYFGIQPLRDFWLTDECQRTQSLIPDPKQLRM